jgi:hypothetical protein
MTMRYMVQSYSLNRGHLEPGFGQFLTDRRQALIAAQRILRTRDGVLVLEQDQNLFGEGEGPMRVLRTYGHVPPLQDTRIAA